MDNDVVNMDPFNWQYVFLSQSSLMALASYLDTKVWVMLESSEGQPDKVCLVPHANGYAGVMLHDETLLDQFARQHLSRFQARVVQRTARQVVDLCLAADVALAMLDRGLLFERPLLCKAATHFFLCVEEDRYLLEYQHDFDGQTIRDALLLRTHLDVKALQVWIASKLNEQDEVTARYIWLISDHPFSETQREHALKERVLCLERSALDEDLQSFEKHFPPTELRAPVKRRVSAGMKAIVVLGLAVGAGVLWFKYQEHERQVAIKRHQQMMIIQQVMQQEWQRYQSLHGEQGTGAR